MRSEESQRARLLGTLWFGAAAPGRAGADLGKAYPWARRVLRFDDVGRYPGMFEEIAKEMGRPLTEAEKEFATGWLPPRAWWHPGPWFAEPDFIEWRCKDAPYFPLMVARGTFGAFCGYVGLPPGHPLHGKSGAAGFDETESITWSSPTGGLLVATGEPPEHWWLGFDCARVHREYQPALVAKDGWMSSILGVPFSVPIRSPSARQYVNVNDVRRRTEAFAVSLTKPSNGA